MLLGTLGASVLGNLLRGKEAIATNQVQGVVRASEGPVRAGQNFWFRLI